MLAVGGQSEQNDNHRDMSPTQGTTKTAEILELNPAGSLTSLAGWRAPATPATAPPGDYFLVVLDSRGVPSTGQLISLRQTT
ncbi:galactose oxidase-like domain-containing protein [Actinophytocola sp.]|uniref:galactose oxidase-like domain-containing protein n=1 Tax=Actinophytocola sp. TaxID=1872138 RepID=UPI00389A925A